MRLFQAKSKIGKFKAIKSTTEKLVEKILLKYQVLTTYFKKIVTAKFFMPDKRSVFLCYFTIYVNLLK